MAQVVDGTWDFAQLDSIDAINANEKKKDSRQGMVYIGKKANLSPRLSVLFFLPRVYQDLSSQSCGG